MSPLWENLPVGSAMVMRDGPAPGDMPGRVMELRTGAIVCQKCADRALRALLGLPGVRRARMLWEEDRVVVEYEPALLEPGGSSDPADPAAVSRWAEALLEAMEGTVRGSDHDDACGLSGGPVFVV